MADSKDFVAGVDSNAKKSPRRIVFITRRTSAQVKADTEDQVQLAPGIGLLRERESNFVVMVADGTRLPPYRNGRLVYFMMLIVDELQFSEGRLIFELEAQR